MNNGIYDIYIFSRDEKEDYYWRPLQNINRINEILNDTRFNKLLKGPLNEGTSEVPKCAFKYTKNSGTYLYIADLKTTRTDHVGRVIRLSALIYSKEFSQELVNLFINVITWQKISEIVTNFDAIFKSNFEFFSIDHKIFERSIALKSNNIAENKEVKYEYNVSNVERVCQYIIKKTSNPLNIKNLFVFSGNGLKISILNDLKPDICLYKELYIDEQIKEKSNKFIYFILFTLFIIVIFIINYIYFFSEEKIDNIQGFFF